MSYFPSQSVDLTLPGDHRPTDHGRGLYSLGHAYGGQYTFFPGRAITWAGGLASANRYGIAAESGPVFGGEIQSVKPK